MGDRLGATQQDKPLMPDRSQTLSVSSPLQGWCASLDDSPDAVFQGKILGNGVSIDPTVGEVHAPFDGEVLTVPDSYHAVNLRAGNGAEFLIHVGIDSVKMAGVGFEAHVAPGEHVKTGQLLLSFDLEKVLRGAASLKSPVLMLHSDDHELFNLRQDGPIEFGEELFEIGPARNESRPADVVSDGPEVSEVVAVGLEHGIHARPAAALIEAIRDLQSKVTIQLGDQQSADARSAVAMMSLGVSYADLVTVKAIGRDAKAAIEAVTSMLEPLDYDPEKALAKPVKPVPANVAFPTPEPLADGAVISAQPASPGLGMGSAYCLNTLDSELAYSPALNGDEAQALSEALDKVRTHLQRLVDSGAGTGSEIATAHLALLEDPLITGAARQKLEEGKFAAEAWRQAVDNAVNTLAAVDDGRMRERTDDLLDINLRVQRALAGQDLEKGPKIPPDSVVIAENMLPSQLLELDHENVCGICLAAGGVTSHVSILAISLNLPMLVAAGREVMSIENGSTVLVDAEFGELQYKPNADTNAGFEKRIEADRVRHKTELSAALDECRTLDGTRIHIHANLATIQDAQAAVEAGAEGCGLLRTEFAFMDRVQAPGLDEQLKTYQQISKALGPRPMVVRTLDAGGDKPISYIEQQTEENPALGVRGIRLGLNNKPLLETQLAALLQLRHDVPLQVMIPMITSVHEITAVRDIMNKIDPSGEYRSRVQLGVMIETPAAALIADRLTEIVDFFSIGTNDLTQYTLCMDRGEPQLASRLDTLHPAVLALIKCTADAAKRADIPVAVCGAGAGDMLISPVLLGLGVHELSMPKSLIARQKARLRLLKIEDCTRVANECLGMNSARQVRAHMRDFVTSN
jgi:phosphoenolpyruvate-protein phosphotransferase